MLFGRVGGIMSVYGRDELTDLEKFLLITTGGMAVEHATNKAAVRFTGMGYRRLFATTAAIFIPAYVAGHIISHHIDPDHGTQTFADVVSDIVTLDMSNLHQRKVAFVRNLVVGDGTPGRPPMHFNNPSDLYMEKYSKGYTGGSI